MQWFVNSTFRSDTHRPSSVYEWQMPPPGLFPTPGGRPLRLPPPRGACPAPRRRVLTRAPARRARHVVLRRVGEDLQLLDDLTTHARDHGGCNRVKLAPRSATPVSHAQDKADSGAP